MRGEKHHPRFVVSDVRCPEFFNLLGVLGGLQHSPAIDAIAAIGKPDRGQRQAQALKLRDECVNVEFRHGDELRQEGGSLVSGHRKSPAENNLRRARGGRGRDQDFTNHQLLRRLFARCVFRFFTSSSGKIVSKLSDGGEAHVAASNDDSDVWCLFTVRSWRRNERRHEGDNDSSDDCGFIRHSVGGGDRAHVEWIVDFPFGKSRHASRATTTSGVKLARPPKRLTLTVAPGGGNASAPVQLVVVFSTPSPRSPASFGWRPVDPRSSVRDRVRQRCRP